MTTGKKRSSRPARKPGNTPGAGNGGSIPPVQHRYKPGQSGNPKGRPSAGATLIEQINALAASKYTEARLKKIARDRSLSWTRRAAAERILRMLEAGDLAEMEGLMDGTMTLKEAKESGVNTEVIKKMKARTVSVGRGDSTETVTTREIELHDRAGHDFDRIIDRTHGKPLQIISHEGEIGLPDAAREIDRGKAGVAALVSALAALGIKADA